MARRSVASDSSQCTFDLFSVRVTDRRALLPVSVYSFSCVLVFLLIEWRIAARIVSVYRASTLKALALLNPVL